MAGAIWDGGLAWGRWCALVVAVSCAALAPARALACRCREPGVATAYRRAASVVLAEAIEVRERPDIQGQEARLRVVGAWKTDAPAVVTVVTGTTCAYLFKPGEKHLVFLVSQQGSLGTGKCMGDLPEGKAKAALAWLARHGKAGAIAPP